MNKHKHKPKNVHASQTEGYFCRGSERGLKKDRISAPAGAAVGFAAALDFLRF